MPDGRWRVTYRDATGHRRHITGADLSTVKAKAARAITAPGPLVAVPIEQLDAFRRWQRAQDNGPPLAEVADAFIESQRRQPRRTQRTQREQEGLVARIVVELGPRRPIGSITTGDLERAVHAEPTHSPRTRAHIRGQLVQLWRWARHRGHLPGDNMVAERLPAIHFQPGAREILTPAELRAVLEHVSPLYLPYVLLAAFAGVRNQEARPDGLSHKRPLGWQDIRLSEGLIVLEAETSKGRRGRRRIIPVAANLAAWLQSLDASNRIGPVCPHRPFTERESRRVAELAGLPRWPHNCLRHSYGSYRMALCRDAPRVSEEMGNSPADVRRHYDAVVPEAEAREWWSIRPESVPNSAVL